MALPIIDEESSVDHPPPPPTAAPPSYDSLQLPRSSLDFVPSSPPYSFNPRHDHYNFCFGLTVRTFILVFSLLSCILNAILFIIANDFLHLGVSEMCLVVSWIVHIFILTAAALRNRSLIIYLYDYLKYAIYLIGICIMIMILSVGIICALTGKTFFFTAVFKKIGGLVVFFVVFAIQLVVQGVFVIDLHKELTHVIHVFH